MKNILFAFLLLASSVSIAEEKDAPATAEDWQKLCENISVFAESLMQARQSGTSMVQSMKLVESGPELFREISKGLVIAAYEKNRWNTPEMAAREIQDFRDTAYMNCIKAKK